MFTRKRRRESAPIIPADKKESIVKKSVSSPSVSSSLLSSLNFDGIVKKKRKLKNSKSIKSHPCDTGEDIRLSSFIRWCTECGIKISSKVSDDYFMYFTAMQ